jgi:hypothetical protein
MAVHGMNQLYSKVLSTQGGITMKSNSIAVTIPEMNNALDLVERTVKTIGYSEEFAAKTRLLTEELIIGNRAIIEDVNASLWVETNDQNMEIHLRLEGGLSASTRKKLAELSLSQCTEPSEGIFSRIGAFFSDAFMDQSEGYTPIFLIDGETKNDLFVPYSVLNDHQLRRVTDYDGMSEAEKTVMMGLADDVTVCAFPKHAELVVAKKLPAVKAQAGA